MEFTQIAKTIIRTEMQKRNINFVELSEKLKEFGINENNINVSQKINRGKFSFDFALTVFKAIGAEDVKIGEYLK